MTDGDNPLLFLTASIHPDGMSFTKLQDSAIRRKQYIEAVRFYLNETDYPILFVENSGTDISVEFANEIASQRLEIITWNGNQYQKSLGKGFGEMLIVAYALEHSRFLKCADIIFKITGRYRVLNIKSYVRECTPVKADVFVDLFNKSPYADSRFWAATPVFLSDFLVRYIERINDTEEFYFEHALFHAAKDAIARGYRQLPLPCLPRYAGVYATDNVLMNSSWLLWTLRNMKRKLRKKNARS